MSTGEAIKQHQMQTFIWMAIMLNSIWEGSSFSLEDVEQAMKELKYNSNMIQMVTSIINQIN